MAGTMRNHQVRRLGMGRMMQVCWLGAHLFIAAGLAGGQESYCGLFRLRSPSSTTITEISGDGWIQWLNTTDGATVTVDVTESLIGSNQWRPFIQESVTSLTSRVQLFDLNPPFRMVFIPGGYNNGEDPDFGQYSLKVSAFWMDRTEVTKAIWDEVFNWAITRPADVRYSFENAGSAQGSNHPVQAVNWFDVVKWCNARSEKEHLPACYKDSAGAVFRSGSPSGVNDVTSTVNAVGYRLPTATEWEYAARGGAIGQRFPWGDTNLIDHSRANYNSWWEGGFPVLSYDAGYQGHDNRYMAMGFPYTAPVGSFPPNGYGLFDMAGNVREWCGDWEPGQEGALRVSRGGDWNSYAYLCRVRYPDSKTPGTSMNTLGFRTIRSPGSYNFITLAGDLAFGSVLVGESAQRMLTISNLGNATLSISGITYPMGFSGNWSGTVPTGGSQNVTVSFSPSSATTYGGNLTVNSDTAGGINFFAISGTGIVPASRIISLGGDLAFGNVVVGQTSQRTLTIENPGNATLTGSGITYPTGFSGSWSGTVAAGGLQNVTVTFSPSSQTSFSGNITVNSDATDGINTKAVSGTGTSPTTRIISLGGDLAFGNVVVGQTSQRTLTIENTGNATLTVSGITYPTGFSGSWSGTIAAGGSQNVTVTFTPSSTTTYGGNLTVNSDATGGANTRAVSGTGTAPATRTISLSGDLAFGNVVVGQTSQRTLTIGNTGNATLAVSGITYPTGFSGNWSGMVAAGGSQNVTVTFSPSSQTSYSGNLTVNSDATGGINTKAVSGTGTSSSTRIISLGGDLAFGNVVVGQTSQRTLTIENTGNSTLTVSGITYPTGFSGSWSGTVAAGGTKNVTVTFSPSSQTSYSGNVTVNSDATGGTNTKTISGTGTPVPVTVTIRETFTDSNGLYNLVDLDQTTSYYASDIDRYWGAIGPSNMTSLYTQLGTFTEMKRISVAARVFRVNNEIKVTRSDSVAYCYIRFYYTDGSQADSITNWVSGGLGDINIWILKEYINPSPQKTVQEIGVWLRAKTAGLTAYEQNTMCQAVSREGKVEIQNSSPMGNITQVRLTVTATRESGDNMYWQLTDGTQTATFTAFDTWQTFSGNFTPYRLRVFIVPSTGTWTEQGTSLGAIVFDMLKQ